MENIFMKERLRNLTISKNAFFVEDMRDDKKNVIVEKSFQFAVQIIEFTDLLKEQKRYSLSNQLFKSGTSIGANIKEAQNAESKQDFIHKMKIAAKEADETEYWLELCVIFGYNVNELISNCHEIQLILSKIISTSKRGRVI
jgi:four helix bundle protein